MSISVLNNVSSLVAENAVSNTQASLQSTLQQLSTGLGSTPERKTQPVCRSQTAWAPTSLHSPSPAKTLPTALVFCRPPTARSPRS